MGVCWRVWKRLENTQNNKEPQENLSRGGGNWRFDHTKNGIYNLNDRSTLDQGQKKLGLFVHMGLAQKQR